MRKHETLKFTAAHTNEIMVETWEYSELSSNSITKDAFNNTHLLPLLPPNQDKKPMLKRPKDVNRKKYIDSEGHNCI